MHAKVTDHDPRWVWILLSIALVAAIVLEAGRLVGQDAPPTDPFTAHAKELQALSPTTVETIDRVVPSSNPQLDDAGFALPVVAKPRLYFLSARNAASFCFQQHAASEQAEIDALRAEYDVHEICLTSLPAIVTDDGRVLTPQIETLFPGSRPIAALRDVLNQTKPKAGVGEAGQTRQRDAGAHTPTAPPSDADVPSSDAPAPAAATGSRPVPAAAKIQPNTPIDLGEAAPIPVAP